MKDDPQLALEGTIDPDDPLTFDNWFFDTGCPFIDFINWFWYFVLDLNADDAMSITIAFVAFTVVYSYVTWPENR